MQGVFSRCEAQSRGCQMAVCFHMDGWRDCYRIQRGRAEYRVRVNMCVYLGAPLTNAAP